MTNQNRIWHDSAHIAEEMDITSCTEELRWKNNRHEHEITKTAEQFSFIIIIWQNDQTLGLRILRITNSNPYTGRGIVRNPITKMASIQIRIEFQIDSTTKKDQATLGPKHPITVNKLSIAATLSQKPLLVQKKLPTEQHFTYTQLSVI